MPTHSLILQTLNNSTLTEELRDAEIETLATIVRGQGIQERRESCCARAKNSSRTR